MQQARSVKAESIWKRRRGASPMESKTNLASSKEVIFCSLPVYGNQICLDGTQQPDYYIIVGKKLETLLKACAYLCGKL